MVHKMDEGFNKEQQDSKCKTRLCRVSRMERVQDKWVKGAGHHEGRDQEFENGQWQYGLHRGQYWSGTGIWHFCSATAVVVSME